MTCIESKLFIVQSVVFEVTKCKSLLCITFSRILDIQGRIEIGRQLFPRFSSLLLCTSNTLAIFIILGTDACSSDIFTRWALLLSPHKEDVFSMPVVILALQEYTAVPRNILVWWVIERHVFFYFNCSLIVLPFSFQVAAKALILQKMYMSLFGMFKSTVGLLPLARLRLEMTSFETCRPCVMISTPLVDEKTFLVK